MARRPTSEQAERMVRGRRCEYFSRWTTPGDTRTARPPAISHRATPRPLMTVGKISLAYCRQMKKAAVMLSLPRRPDTNLSEEKSCSQSVSQS